MQIGHNDIAGNYLDILATHYDRGAGALGRYETTGLDVHDNWIRITGTKPTGLRVYTGEDHLYTQGGNGFRGNSYELADGSPAFWWNGDKDMSAWQALGFDTEGGTFASTESFSAVRSPYSPQGYGHAA